MTRDKGLEKVILLGSGALKIGEAGEFDYSGSQAAKALKEEKIQVILVNPNVATIQTSPDFVDKIYFLPVTPDFVERIIAKEKPDGIMLGFGGQTALNCGLELHKRNIFKKYNLKVLGTPISAINKTEDRLLFRNTIQNLGLRVPKSVLCKSLKEVEKIRERITYPVIIRAGFSLGGLGSGLARNYKDLILLSSNALSLTPQILIEEYLEHWKEIEYEVVRDKDDNVLTVCNMENFDPMGIHTGESIVVAPSQTLTNSEYHDLRSIAIKVIKSLPIIGECNIQYALNPKNGDYRIIEVNARLSRSSALASKATGYPLAYIAAKLALGYRLSEIRNKVTKATNAFFEPALDYVVIKIPRWEFLKFKGTEGRLGSEMQSVGEVMAIGRTFEEAFQKAIRSLDIEYEGIISEELEADTNKRTEIEFKNMDPTPSRPYNIAYNLYFGQPPERIYKETGIDFWFLERIQKIVSVYKQLVNESKNGRVKKESLLKAKKSGFSDIQIGKIFNMSHSQVRKLRKKYGIIPKICQIDTLAGEFPAKTNYLYLSYHRDTNDILRGTDKQVGIIGGGPYQIGSSVEFDWCAVNAVLTSKKLGYKPIMINCNPETVSTDYDISSKLYFEELTSERILDIVDFEKCPLILSVGGQIPNTLALALNKEKIRFLGNQPDTIDKVENREKFSALLDKLNIAQPIWRRLTNKNEAVQFSEDIGYPVLIRPSYVLSGKAMYVAYTNEMLEEYFERFSAIINPVYPIVISKFIRGAKEVDYDGVAQNGKIVVYAISEHIEHAGVHSGDASLVLPTFSLSAPAIEEMRLTSKKIAKALSINGPFNIQYLVSDHDDRNFRVLVIEANLRASRSFPFVSKVLGINFIQLATKVLLGRKVKQEKFRTLPFYGIKVPHFSFTRLRQVDPILRVEMASTGEVACFGKDIYEAYLKSILSTGFSYPDKSALLSLGGTEGKERLLSAVKNLNKMGFYLYATKKTSEFLKIHGISSTFVYKVHERKKPNVVDLIVQKKVHLVINLSDKNDIGEDISKEVTDGYLIRRASVDSNIPLFTKATIANVFVTALAKYSIGKLSIKSWDEYISSIKY
ncbi:carbamoyl phosphate synthase large subunit [Candidatus Gottesmanbacteria bacterium CG11_big_fil_rev_8_21_14_0_20_37_11]|uniref:Carbamoyl phosphate synthase arginine-specific large chain n=3 Tax=Candidatus Gottesmaniibacteriota TaxID=1752720 RepID=A0A2M7RSG1_9BACT|nr:MAG: carbamoyl phosphate synthase large subunit [Candidatus Gottesmanbacteria bacterium CG1_02_37_22]PIR07971.1 MAG: carbamoyl phosphate synthase large subunit [Candidatus Gottesmanbacteria bacterium CG11_big_fil_rev_8_21_14_0_20_37_11]PIZ03243.1 MAG: carbamoyl phosphate synthase large subunit [Candidatus Gottesmanbacteria bacterium CG_4_10_14_0_8_um_filter_37_24]